MSGRAILPIGFLEAVETKRSHVVVGLDPDYDLLPRRDPGRPIHESAYASDGADEGGLLSGSFLRTLLEASA